jgi:hypothetical protein
LRGGAAFMKPVGSALRAHKRDFFRTRRIKMTDETAMLPKVLVPEGIATPETQIPNNAIELHFRLVVIDMDDLAKPKLRPAVLFGTVKEHDFVARPPMKVCAITVLSRVA